MSSPTTTPCAVAVAYADNNEECDRKFYALFALALIALSTVVGLLFAAAYPASVFPGPVRCEGCVLAPPSINHSDTSLHVLRVDSGELQPPFTPGIHEYRLDLKTNFEFLDFHVLTSQFNQRVTLLAGWNPAKQEQEAARQVQYVNKIERAELFQLQQDHQGKRLKNSEKMRIHDAAHQKALDIAKESPLKPLNVKKEEVRIANFTLVVPDVRHGVTRSMYDWRVGPLQYGLNAFELQAFNLLNDTTSTYVVNVTRFSPQLSLHLVSLSRDPRGCLLYNEADTPFTGFGRNQVQMSRCRLMRNEKGAAFPYDHLYNLFMPYSASNVTFQPVPYDKHTEVVMQGIQIEPNVDGKDSMTFVVEDEPSLIEIALHAPDGRHHSKYRIQILRMPVLPPHPAPPPPHQPEVHLMTRKQFLKEMRGSGWEP
ncbi:hypothetical protein CYMTET_52649 [Cymbomonas tetramitiformis]|uniref:Uncharacterized protein n=1 Tax=Cymbomonas tetramitiformis TaxID=36881 RepID=A0AAE0BJY3_9CHLO|nr:hypothetical protein CYMTET_52649 [Cymbomonas tetramitiformis]